MYLGDNLPLPHEGIPIPHEGHPSDEELVECINFHSFCAHYEGVEGVRSSIPSLTMRKAFEGNHDKEPSDIHDACIMTAAQWILWDGQELFKASRSWMGKEFTKKKWQGWKQEFIHAASSGEFGQECRIAATKAVERMDALDGETLARSIQVKT